MSLRGLTVFALLALSLLWSQGVLAAGGYSTAAEAHAACQAFLDGKVAGGMSLGDQKCTDSLNANGVSGSSKVTGHGGAAGYTFDWAYPTPAQCAAKPSVRGVAGGLTETVCHSGCQYKPIDSVMVSIGGNSTGAHGTYGPTGATCSGEGIDTGGAASPRICGGGSCYDPNSDRYCAVDSSGAQMCVQGSAARSPSSTGSGTGGCSAGATGASCAGSDPPSPPPSPASPISDPATEATSSDTYHETHASSSGGGGAPSSTTNVNVTVNNYGAGGAATAPTASGQQPGDVGPAPASSTGGAGDGEGEKGSASGGRNCNSPPICTGDAPTCMVATQVWLARCEGDGSKSNDGDTSVPGLDGIGDGTASGGGKPWFQDGGSVLDKLDASGFGGGNVCPSMPAIQIPMFNVDFQEAWPHWCEILDAAGVIIMLLSGFIALRILSE